MSPTHPQKQVEALHIQKAIFFYFLTCMAEPYILSKELRMSAKEPYITAQASRSATHPQSKSFLTGLVEPSI